MDPHSRILELVEENARLTARAEKAEAYMDRFAAESNRLREALEKIAEHQLPFLKSSEIEIAEIARAALVQAQKAEGE
jgi:hypothetical protein